jgi:hypothetical protein
VPSAVRVRRYRMGGQRWSGGPGGSNAGSNRVVLPRDSRLRSLMDNRDVRPAQPRSSVMPVRRPATVPPSDAEPGSSERPPRPAHRCGDGRRTRMDDGRPEKPKLGPATRILSRQRVAADRGQQRRTAAESRSPRDQDQVRRAGCRVRTGGIRWSPWSPAPLAVTMGATGHGPLSRAGLPLQNCSGCGAAAGGHWDADAPIV